MYVTYEDTAGIKLFLAHKLCLKFVGITSDLGQIRSKMAFGVGMVFAGLTLCYGHALVSGMFEALADQDFLAVSNGLAMFSLTLSASNKAWILHTQSGAIMRVALWAKTVKMGRAGRTPILEVLVYHMNKGFDIMALSVAVYWSLKPLISGPILRPKFPLLPSDHWIVLTWFYRFQPILYAYMAFVISYMATSLVHLLVVFRSELFTLAEQWKSVVHVQGQPNEFSNKLKQLVNEHVHLTEVLKDIRVIHEEMFGFQVLIAISVACAFISYSVKNGFGSATIVTMLPMIGGSTIEFFLLCWVGEEITHGFDLFSKNLCLTNWYEASIKDKKSMLVALTIMKKPIVLTGAKVFLASLHTFVMAMREAFSLYTLLKALMS